MSTSTRYPVERVYTMAHGLQAVARARAHDVEKGGIYDARFAAINIWSDTWASDAQEAISDTVGTIYLHWHTPDRNHCTVYQLEVDAGWQFGDVERHLGLLFGPERSVLPGDKGTGQGR